MKFVTLRVDTGPRGIVELTMPGATTMGYAGTRFAERLGLDTEENRYFLLGCPQGVAGTPVGGHLDQYPREALAADYDGVLFVLGSEPLAGPAA